MTKRKQLRGSDAYEDLRRAIQNTDAREAIKLARLGKCSRAGRSLDRARDMSRWRTTSDQAKVAGLIVRKLCPKNKEVAKATFGLRGSGRKR